MHVVARASQASAGDSSEGGASSGQLTAIDKVSDMDEQALMELSQSFSCEDSAQVAYQRKQTLLPNGVPKGRRSPIRTVASLKAKQDVCAWRFEH